jgi:hypothetical protein
MNSIVNSLAEISTEYSIFQKDQVLTEAQLNSVSDYLDDQDRLSRVALVGVGIICGLRVSLAGSQVVLGKGLGITTDGDLMRLAGDMTFTRYKPYDKQFPAYGKLYRDATTMFRAFELVASGQVDPLATNLSRFQADTQLPLDGMLAVLLMESYIKTHELCSGADCDNHSQKYVGTLKLLLVEPAALGQLLPAIQTSDQAARALGAVVAPRALVKPGSNDLGNLWAPFRQACNTMHEQLQVEFRKLWPACSFLLNSTFAGDPAPAWVNRLAAIRNAFNGDQAVVQYYYDFLRDLVDTWNEMRDCLFGETAWCCPDIDGFPKHLLLGRLAPGADPDEHRLGFYPSAAVNRDRGLHRAVFLADKLDVLLAAFNHQDPAAVAAGVTVTPSRCARFSLGERAIPCYFRIDGQARVVRAWNHELSRRGEERRNYSCNHAAYRAVGAAAQPLESAIDGYDFFRIEGHIGRDVQTVQATLERLIRQYNLPFGVSAVLLGADQRQVVIKPPRRYTDLNRFHYLIRQDLAQKMDDVKAFSGSFKAGLADAIQRGIVRDDSSTNDGSSVRALAEEKDRSVQKKADAARVKLNRSFAEFAADKSWMQDIGETMVAASEFKLQLNKVVNTSFPTSFDTLIGSPTWKWLPWLDKFIEDRESKAEEKRLLAKFLAANPGLEHAAGVVRGGLFVLVYKQGGEVVADFMLSHCCEQEIEEAVAEPPLFKPDFPIDDVIKGGIKINPSRELFVKERLDTLKLDIEERWTPKLEVYSKHNQAITGLLDVMKAQAQRTKVTVDPGLTLTRPGAGLLQPTDTGAGLSGVLRPGRNDLFKDEVLGVATERVRAETEIIKVLNEKIEDPTVDVETKRQLERERDKTETKLKDRIVDVTAHLNRSQPDADFGSEAHDTLEVVAAGMRVIKNPNQLEESKKAVEVLTKPTVTNRSLRFSATHVLNRPG